MPAFRAAARRGFVLEVDVKLTKDRVPIVIHDATLDRTTPCAGQVSARTYADIHANCPSDIVGTDGNFVQLGPNDRRRAPLPRLSDFLAFARDAGARINLEIKNIPSDPDFDNTPAYATTVIDAIKASGFPPSRLIIQSFWFPNLDLAKQLMPTAETSFLQIGGGQRRTVVPRRPRLRLGLGAVAARRPVRATGAPARDAGGPVHARHARPDRRGRDERRGRADHERPAARAQDARPRSTRSRRRSRRRRASRPAARRARAARSARSRRTARTATASGSSRCSPSRRPATWSATRASAPRSSA